MCHESSFSKGDISIYSCVLILPFLLTLTDVFTRGNVFKILVEKEFV